MNRFETFKKEILKRAKEAGACKVEYRRALNSDSFSALINVIKDNIKFCVRKNITDEKLIKEYEREFEQEEIFCNKNVGAGLLLVFGNASVEASGNASVMASGNASVMASGNATVVAWDNASVEAWDNASVEACDNAYVEACGNASVEACDNASVEAWDDAYVEAFGNAYVYSYSRIECKLKENAIYRCKETNTIYYASEGLKFEKM